MGMMKVRIHGKCSVSRRAVLWLAREYGSISMTAGTCAFEWRRNPGGVSIRAHGIIVRTMRECGLFSVQADGSLRLTELGASMAARLLVPPPILARSERHEESGLFWLSDEQMRTIAPVLPSAGGQPRKEDRAVISGLVHVLRSGIAWEHAPARYGKPSRLMDRFRRWSIAGVLDDIFANLTEERSGVLRLVVDGAALIRHRSGKLAAMRGCFPTLAPVEEMPCAA